MLPQPNNTSLRMAVLAQPQSPTVVMAALTPIATVVADAMPQPRKPPLLVAKLQRRGHRLTQPPKEVLAHPRQAATVGRHIVGNVVRSPHHQTLATDNHILTKVSGNTLADVGLTRTP